MYQHVCAVHNIKTMKIKRKTKTFDAKMYNNTRLHLLSQIQWSLTTRGKKNHPVCTDTSV